MPAPYLTSYRKYITMRYQGTFLYFWVKGVLLLDKFPPVLKTGKYKYFSYCPVCGCVANYSILYTYSCFASLKFCFVYGYRCLDCYSEIKFDAYSVKVLEYGGVDFEL